MRPLFHLCRTHPSKYTAPEKLVSPQETWGDETPPQVEEMSSSALKGAIEAVLRVKRMNRDGGYRIAA